MQGRIMEEEIIRMEDLLTHPSAMEILAEIVVVMVEEMVCNRQTIRLQIRSKIRMMMDPLLLFPILASVRVQAVLPCMDHSHQCQ